jgi:benzoyl-CoA-dihydrodiol lyase
MDVDENAALFEGYQLKRNSYDLGVDIELADAVQRLRFEHPEVKVVVLRSGKDQVFCAGANIRMLAGSTHAHKVNFCKFTNETRNGIEDASASSGQKYLCAVRGTAAGGGYELALATDHIVLADDGNSAVSLPELPLLAVLPGTGGLTRVTDKRKVRRDLADAFCTVEEGVKGARAVKWRLVDQAVPNSKFEAAVKEAAARLAHGSDRPGASTNGIALTPLDRKLDADAVTYSCVKVELERPARRATITLQGPDQPPPASAEAMHALGAQFWPLRLARELDDAILNLRLNEGEIGLRHLSRRQQEPLARPGDPQLLETHAEARRSHLALAGGADRARQLLCRHARRDRLRLRPLVHADRRLQGRQPPGGHPDSVEAQLRPLPDEQRPHPSRHPFPGRARERRQGGGRDRQGT